MVESELLAGQHYRPETCVLDVRLREARAAEAERTQGVTHRTRTANVHAGESPSCRGFYSRTAGGSNSLLYSVACLRTLVQDM